MDSRQLLQSTLVLTGSTLVARTPGKIKNGDNGDIACDSYHRFSDDIALQRQLNLKSCRYSIAWPRIQPIGRGPANAEGLDYYKRLTSALPIGSVRRTLISADISGIGVIKSLELSYHATGPAKTVLQQVFTATPARLILPNQDPPTRRPRRHLCRRALLPIAGFLCRQRSGASSLGNQ